MLFLLWRGQDQQMAVGVLAGYTDYLKGLWFQISCLKFCGRGKSTTYTTVSNLAPRNSFVLPQESLSAADILILLGLKTCNVSLKR